MSLDIKTVKYDNEGNFWVCIGEVKQMTKAVNIAREFLRLAKEDEKSMTNMQLQKLVYIAHGVHLARENETLLDEEVNAWKHGPVIPDVYYAFKQYLNTNIDLDKEVKNQGELNAKELESIQFTYDNFGEYNGWTLREVTHRKGSPWYKIWYDGNGNETFNAVIPNKDIQEHYKNIFKTERVVAL